MKKGKEEDHWKHVTPDMMSDEEKSGSSYVRHQPLYRSDQLNTFLRKLDERSEKQNLSHARFSRDVGSPVSKPVPISAQPWMLKDEYKSNATTIAGSAEMPAENNEKEDNMDCAYQSESLFTSESDIDD